MTSDDGRITPTQLLPDHYWLQLKGDRIYPWCASRPFLVSQKGSYHYFANTQSGVAKEQKPVGMITMPMGDGRRQTSIEYLLYSLT